MAQLDYLLCGCDNSSQQTFTETEDFGLNKYICI